MSRPLKRIPKEHVNIKKSAATDPARGRAGEEGDESPYPKKIAEPSERMKWGKASGDRAVFKRKKEEEEIKDPSGCSGRGSSVG